MPLVALLWGFFYTAIGSIVGRILLTLGMGLVTYTGIDLLLGAARTQIFSSFAASGAVFLQFAGVLQLGTAINILLSAVVMRFTLSGVTAGSITKMVTKA